MPFFIQSSRRLLKPAGSRAPSNTTPSPPTHQPGKWIGFTSDGVTPMPAPGTSQPSLGASNDKKPVGADQAMSNLQTPLPCCICTSKDGSVTESLEELPSTTLRATSTSASIYAARHSRVSTPGLDQDLLAPPSLGAQSIPVAHDESVTADSSFPLPFLYHNALYTPVPMEGSPTELLAERFQSWRKFLKELIVYIDEFQHYYDSRARSLEKAAIKAANAVAGSPGAFTLKFRGSITTPGPFAGVRLTDIFGDEDARASEVVADRLLEPVADVMGLGGVGLAVGVLSHHHRQAAAEATQTKGELAGLVERLVQLRADLEGKIREIRGLSSDFRNNLAKEMTRTGRLVEELGVAINKHGLAPQQSQDSGTALVAHASHKRDCGHLHISNWRWESRYLDPCLLRLKVDHQVKRQVEEENYVHQAYLNLESSGQKLEAVIVSQVRQAFRSLVNVLHAEVEMTTRATRRLQIGPLAEREEREWEEFVASVEIERKCHDRPPGRLIPSRFPSRNAGKLEFPGSDHASTKVLCSGYLERKSKYVNRYSPGWYVLTPTHLHEFPRQYGLADQRPTLSLALRDRAIRVSARSKVADLIGSKRASGAVNAEVAFQSEQQHEAEENGMDSKSKRSGAWPTQATVLQPIEGLHSQPYYRFLIKPQSHIVSSHKRHRRSSSSPGKMVCDGRKPLLLAPSWIFRTTSEADMERWAVAIARAIYGLRRALIPGLIDAKGIGFQDSTTSLLDELEGELDDGETEKGENEGLRMQQSKTGWANVHKRTRSLPTNIQSNRTAVYERQSASDIVSTDEDRWEAGYVEPQNPPDIYRC